MGVTLEDIATTLLRPTPQPTSADGKAWLMWARDARRQIERRLGDIDALNYLDVEFVIREAVALKVKRPDAAVKIDVAVDDASISRTYEKSAGHVTILDEWWAILTPADDSPRGAFTITPGTRPGTRRCS